MAGEDPKWTAFVRSLPCAMCLKPAPSECHHSTAHGRGLGQKAHDHQSFPLCGPFGCHQAFHDHRGKFSTWTKQQRKLWQRTMVQLYGKDASGDSSPEEG